MNGNRDGRRSRSQVQCRASGSRRSWSEEHRQATRESCAVAAESSHGKVTGVRASHRWRAHRVSQGLRSDLINDLVINRG